MLRYERDRRSNTGKKCLDTGIMPYWSREKLVWYGNNSFNASSFIRFPPCYRREVLTAASMKMTVFWGVAQCCLTAIM
jgi:hypothetical protein